MIGRNELCPCGSGKKYKKCCLQRNQLAEFTRNKTMYAKGLYVNLSNKIVDYSNRIVFKDDKESCKKDFYISTSNNEKINKLFMTYYIQDYITSNKKVIANMYIEEYNTMLNKNQKSILLGMINSYLSVFKIEEIKTTQSIIQDVFTEERIVIEDIDLFNVLSVGDNIIGRPVNTQGMNIFLDPIIKISCENTQKIKDNIYALHKNSNYEFSTNIKEFLVYNSEIIYKYAQQILINGELNFDDSLIISNDKNNEEYKKEEKNNIDIYGILKENMEEKYLQQGIDLWTKFMEVKKSIKGSESGWAAAIEYYIKKDAGEVITQVQVSQKYEISPRTLGKRYKELKVS